MDVLETISGGLLFLVLVAAGIFAVAFIGAKRAQVALAQDRAASNAAQPFASTDSEITITKEKNNELTD